MKPAPAEAIGLRHALEHRASGIFKFKIEAWGTRQDATQGQLFRTAKTGSPLECEDQQPDQPIELKERLHRRYRASLLGPPFGQLPIKWRPQIQGKSIKLVEFPIDLI